MDKKNLAKGVMAALLLAGTSANAALLDAKQEANTFLAVAACAGGGYNTAPPRGYQYQQTPANYDYVVDDTNNPYARPSQGGGYGYNPDRQSPMGGGYGYTSEYPVNSNPSYSSEWQSEPFGQERRVGGGNPQNYPAQSSPYNRNSYNTNPNYPTNPSTPLSTGGGGAAA